MPSLQATVVCGLQLNMQPHFSLVIRGEPLLVLTGPDALFEALVLFLAHCSREAPDAGIGGGSLQYLGLADILRPEKLLFSGIKLGWLFP
jgi:hypothetical protein